MNCGLEPLQQLNQRAWQVLIREIGVVDAIRFLHQYRVGCGNYTSEREQIPGDMSLKNIVKAIRKQY